MPRWLSVPDYEGVYSVSDLGQVRIEVRRHNIQAGTLLRQTVDRDGYLRTGLNKTGANSRNQHIARIVLSAFVGPPQPQQQANHTNGDRQDNRLENLEWVTPAENIAHAIKKPGRVYKGTRNPAAKLTEDQVLAIRARATTGESYAQIAPDFSITPVMVRCISIGKAWPHLGGPRQGKRPVGRPPKKQG